MGRCGRCPATDQQDPSTVYQVNYMDSVKTCCSIAKDMAYSFWGKGALTTQHCFSSSSQGL